MDIHFPLLGFNLSGGVRVIIRLANGLADRGHRVRITVPAYRATPPFPLSPNVELVVMGKKTVSRLDYVRRLVKEAARWGDVLVATNFKTPHVLSRSRKKTGRHPSLIYYVQGYEPYTQGTLLDGPMWRRGVNRLIALRSYRLVDRRVYVSETIARRVGMDQNPIIVHPGVDTDVFQPRKISKREKPVVGVISRPGRLKGMPVFLDAWAQLGEQRNGVELSVLLVDEKPANLPTTARVKVTRNDQEVAEFYRGLDIFVMPSLYEGFPLPPLEAMASGATVVTASAGGVVEYARDGENSLVVPTGDAESLAKALRSVLTSRTLRRTLSDEGLRTAREYSWDRTIQKFEKALQAM